eukprot:CAMPEP_0174260596 /NCGR_PEP_ID=MMETSP0439-20130205/10019_1 /TAXON_ID=0 /ORGANISM="Stereomyxa ramosa, Strain Chinc5" /LENGTH=424 /DNA_ID=CAMNT_0015344871 /DNA_START=122 /DNA_END=1392 /DNA_ORIENTATION=+
MTETEPYVVYMTKTPKTLAIRPESQSDPFYRYKMRQLVVQTIGNGKMIRTSFTNLCDVAKDLKVPPDYIPHYLGKAIGAQAKYDSKKPERQRGTISGEYSVKLLSDLLVQFISHFVLCDQCQAPELSYSASSSRKDLRMRCRACGWKGVLSATDADEKFKRYVYTHPPPQEGGSKSKTSKKDRNGRRNRNNGKGKGRQEDTGLSGWSDVSEEAMEKRIESIPDRLKSLIVTDGEEVVDQTLEEELASFFTRDPKPSEEKMISEVLRMQNTNSFDRSRTAALVFDATFPDLLSMKPKIEEFKAVLYEYIGKEPLTQAKLLSLLEDRIDKGKKADVDEFIAKHATFVLKQLYDEEILEEDTILQWHASVSEEKWDPLRKKVLPLITWLKTADEEGDSEEESEEESEGPAESSDEGSDDFDDEIDAR